MNVPNLLTLLRFSLVPLIAVEILRGAYVVALILFVVSAISDVADGAIARHWNQLTRFGAIADPLADKLTMLTVTVLLWMLDALPWWFALAVVLRDALIVAGALAYELVRGAVEMAPSRISKINTGFEFMLLLAVLAIHAGLLPDGTWRTLLLAATLVTIVLSGGSYVIVWSGKAARFRRAAASGKHPS